MPVVVVFTTAGDRGGSARGTSPAGDRTEAVRRAATVLRDRFGLRLVPMHPTATDAALARYYQVELGERDRPEAVIEALRGLPQVDAAYFKPPEALPLGHPDDA